MGLQAQWAMAMAPLLASGALRAEPVALRVGIPEGLPGYTVGADGSLLIESAMKSRVVHCIERALNARLLWQPAPTRRVEQALADRRLDLVFPMGFNEDRAARLMPSEPTWDSPDVWVSMRPIDAQDRRLRLAVRLGSPQHNDYKGLGYARLASTYSYEELPRMLRQDMVDAAVLPRSIYESIQSMWPAGHLLQDGKARSTVFYLHKDDPRQLAGPLNQAVRRCRGG